MTSIIRNHDLAAAGQKKIAWVEHYMPTLNNIGERLKKEQTFQDKTVVVSVHLEAKTAYLALVLHQEPRSSSRAAIPYLHRMM